MKKEFTNADFNFGEEYDFDDFTSREDTTIVEDVVLKVIVLVDKDRGSHLRKIAQMNGQYLVSNWVDGIGSTPIPFTPSPELKEFIDTKLLELSIE